MPEKTIAVSISGSGGSGVVTAGMILLKSMANAGYYGYLSRFSGPQIRGGESAVLLNCADHPIEEVARFSDIHFALDWRGFERFGDEIPLSATSCVVFDSSREILPDIVAQTGAKTIDVKLHEAVQKYKGSRPNAFAIGIIASLLGLPLEPVSKAVQQTFATKDASVVGSTYSAIEMGYEMLGDKGTLIEKWGSAFHTRWNISGNEACALGALRGGIKLAAAYPITPASDITEYLAPRLEKVGGNVLIAEDELAAINMIIGGSFGGKPSMTATSGPGLSLMSEAMGLAVASETPVLVINVTRGGPSTGIPTKSEQTDLNQALYGMHGEAPHVVVAPLNIADCVDTTQWAVGLAEALQTLAVLLSDQRLGQSRAIINAVPTRYFGLKRRLWTEEDKTHAYQRYALTPDHISPMSIPGNKTGCYTADGLEHDPSGMPSPCAKDHLQQLTKREQKTTVFDYGEMWAESLNCDQKAETIVLTWGSTYTHAKLAVSQLIDAGYAIELLAPRLLMPLKVNAIKERCEGKKIIVVEQSYSGQFYHYCLSQGAIAPSALLLAQPGPLVLKTAEIKRFIKETLA